jgi:DNA polymerase (family 10)
MTKNEIADVLAEIGVLMELKGENPFKVRAYSGGARAIEALEKDEFEKLVAEGGLQSVKGIGEALAAKIAELHSDRAPRVPRQAEGVDPAGPGRDAEDPRHGPEEDRGPGPELGVTSIAELEKACKDGRVAGARRASARRPRRRSWRASATGRPTRSGTSGGTRTRSRSRSSRGCGPPQVERAETAGSLRRGLETVGDLDFIVAAEDVGPSSTGSPAMAGSGGDGQGRHQGERPPGGRPAGRPSDSPGGPVRLRAPPFHGLKGPQCADAPARSRERAEPERMGPRPREGEGTAKDKASRNEGKKAADETALFAALGLSFIPARAARGLGRDRGGREGRDPEARRD